MVRPGSQDHRTRGHRGGPPRIYVQVPAYRDVELPATLLDLYAKARNPEALRVGVVWQHAPRETLSAKVRRLPNLEIIDVPYQQSRGCNWARRLLQKRWRDEPYTLFIDSHHRFVAHWDEMIVGMYRGLHDNGVRRPLLTTYLPEYRPDTDPFGRKRQPYKIYPLGREDGLLVRLTSFPIPYWRALRAPIPADFVSLHFLFTAGRFNRDVPFDPGIYFFGDEVATGVRAYTHGYDLFHPHQVVGWHCFDRATRVPHWNDHPGWRRQHARSLGRLRALFKGELPGRFGAGKRRTVAGYQRRLNLALAEAA